MALLQHTDIQAISPGLSLGDDGIWYSSGSQPIHYPSDGYDSCFSVEDASFWFRHRNNCIKAMVKSFHPSVQDTIFDIGGGNGFVSKGLAEAGYDVALVEPGSAGAMNARKRGLKTVICATTDAAQFKEHSLPAVGLFDVIEHTQDDIAFLKSIHAKIKKGGMFYATVPAYACLWSQDDVVAGHFRRYTLEQIVRVLEQSGFDVIFQSYIFRPLPLPIFLLRALPFRLGLSRNKPVAECIARDHATRGGGLQALLDKILTPEICNLEKRRSMSFGGTCLIVARAR